MPMAINRMAAMTRNTCMSKPMPKPIVATNIPIETKEITSPAANAAGASRCSLTAVEKITGSSGNTHGDKVERMPAT